MKRILIIDEFDVANNLKPILEEDLEGQVACEMMEHAPSVEETNGVDAIVIEPFYGSNVPVELKTVDFMRQMKAKGVPVVLYTTSLDYLKANHDSVWNGDAQSAVCKKPCDPMQVSYTLAEQLGLDIPEELTFFAK